MVLSPWIIIRKHHKNLKLDNLKYHRRKNVDLLWIFGMFDVRNVWLLLFLVKISVDQVATSNDQNKNNEPVVNKELEQSLVIPEKASSFKVHPERICKDQCFYCGGKFGLYDTPCHIAQIKSTERQNKILESKLRKISI